MGRAGMLVAATALLAAGCGQGGAAKAPGVNGSGAEWAASFWNPQPAEGDVVIDGPCGSRFVFRIVKTPTDTNWLADVNVALGQSAEAEEGQIREITEQVRQGSVVGGFAEEDDASRRFYYIGKYEVTANQYEAVMVPGCKAPVDEKNVPVEKVSRFDAAEFTRRLSEYGFAHAEARAKLPSAGSAPAFVRLPTEAEWEFAARGGAAVTAEERLAPAYPMDAEPRQFEWYAADDSCRGALQPAGLLRPNPLGLHDMLGNASEIVSDPFQINRGGRLHGQPGGVTAKGSSCTNRVEELRSAARTEYPEYDVEGGRANGPPMVGFRLALGTPVIPSNQRLEDLQSDWETLRRPQTARQDQDPAEELRRLAAKQADLPLAQEMLRHANAFDTELAHRAEVEATSARMAVSNGALLIRNYRFVSADITRSEQALKDLGDLGKASPAATAIRDGVGRAKTLRTVTRDLYTQLLQNTANDFPPKVLDDALKLERGYLAGKYGDVGTGVPIADMACMFASQARKFAAEKPSNLEPYMTQLIDGNPAAFSASCN